MSTEDRARPGTEPTPPTSPIVTPPGATLGAAARAAGAGSGAAHVAERAHPTPPAPTPATGAPIPLPPAAPVAPETTSRRDAAHKDRDDVVDPTGTPGAEVFPTPVPPRRVGFGGHLLGAVLGLVAGPLAVLVAGLGESRIVTVYGPPRTAWVDNLGTSLVVLGALLLIGIVVLGLWTAAVPITAGAAITAVGLAFIVIPETTYTEVLRHFRTEANASTVEQLALRGVSGAILLIGVLVLTAGIITSIARRAGRRRGTLVAAIDQARAA